MNMIFHRFSEYISCVTLSTRTKGSEKERIMPSATATTKRNAGAIATVMFLASLLISGSNGVLADGVALTSGQIVFFRMLIGAGVLVVAFVAMRRKITVLGNKRELAFLIGGGAAMACELLFLYEAYRYAGVALSTILCYLAPIVVMALSPVLFHERLTLPKGVSFAVVVAGCLLINMTALGDGVSARGILYGIGAAAGMSAMVILNKKVTDTPGLERALVQMVSSAAICTLYVTITAGLATTFAAATAAGAWPALAVIGLLGGISNLLYFAAIGRLPVQSVAVFGYLEPLSAVLMSVFILGEHMMLLQIVGAVLIIGGALASETLGKKNFADNPAKPAFGRRHSRHAA